jgi:hypothetical protein
VRRGRAANPPPLPAGTTFQFQNPVRPQPVCWPAEVGHTTDGWLVAARFARRGNRHRSPRPFQWRICSRLHPKPSHAHDIPAFLPLQKKQRYNNYAVDDGDAASQPVRARERATGTRQGYYGVDIHVGQRRKTGSRRLVLG